LGKVAETGAGEGIWKRRYREQGHSLTNKSQKIKKTVGIYCFFCYNEFIFMKGDDDFEVYKYNRHYQQKEIDP